MYSNILVALDGSELSVHAFYTALMLASQTGARLSPVYVVALPAIAANTAGFDLSSAIDELTEEGQRIVGDAMKKMAKRGVTGTPQVVQSEPVGADIAWRILRLAQETKADLIVMGTHGRSGLKRLLLGSVAEHVLREAECPVLTISARGAAVPEAGRTDEPGRASS